MSGTFALVAVENTVYHFDRLFTYQVPSSLLSRLSPGMRVMVPFGPGNRERVGMVFSLNGEEASGVKEILSLLDMAPVLSENQLKLAQWMQNRYFCTLFEAVKLMVPTGIHLKVKNSYILAPDFKDFDREGYTTLQWRLLLFLREAGHSVPLEKLESDLGISQKDPEFLALLEKGAVCRVSSASGKVGDAVSKMLRPIPDFSGKLSPRQKTVFEVLCDAGEASEKELSYFTGASSAVLKALVSKGAAESFQYEVYRRPDSGVEVRQPGEIALSPQQSSELQKLIVQYEGEKGCALLYGVTGSGKTSVFLKLIDYVTARGRGVIAMVPEISLTAQAISQFRGLFGDQVALFHSGLSLGERLDEWKRVKRGEARIVIGTRSAVFAPVKDLGLIVLDEEQEHTYRSESSPRYDAREIARFRCGQEDALCLFSSATPSLESFYLAQEKKYRLYQLPSRFGEAVLPEVQLIDQNLEPPGEGQEIGPTLADALQENFRRGEQSIILLNRRGYHTFASCRSCHETLNCPHCSISLTYHSANGRLMCHYCGYSIPFTKVCPSCKQETVVFRGGGTQRAEEQLNLLLPDAAVLRIDTDSVSQRHSLERKLDDFAKGRYQVMVGTQMVAKGLNFENVTLVGVLSADQSLYSDDFRSNERTFDLLTQVVGRSGRGKTPGRAMVQTFFPENPVLSLAASQDYLGFYEREIAYRRALLYPPFSDLLLIGFVGEKEVPVRKGAEVFLQRLSALASAEYGKLPLRVLPPSPAAVVKLNGKYRYKMIIKHRNTAAFREMISRLLKEASKEPLLKEITVYADPNPYTVL